ncbi:MAG: hypothetical protein A2762_00070 [Candidatus Lloydbacteria bacterium RIFCSPHIGHO2_01_FULL_54_11]|nr:MAG: hypothetical protein A2762_00070 [Candidatus Lloydbacteria bacterium RIFCSPHIGHO2_01_FULL_54_11]OGZ13204.1 MAG: hypothetical protein A2948_06025 [Candidatus Lloydbacteria bacterium RIFCSPLOWO2_01_FULL_54_18]OGZ17051.1 MAG: hypothetical protein A3H76_01045 [Candidatus Lloydbacteria bacterium RIFCSPLOWO2_02_FULL_54_12]
MNEEKDKTTRADILGGLRAIWRHIRPFKRTLLILAGLGIVSAIANGVVPYVTGRFFDALIGISRGESPSEGGLPLWALLLSVWVFLQLVANNIDWVIDRMQRSVNVKLHLKIQSDGFIHLFRLPLAYHKNAHINGVLQKLSNAGWRVSAIMHTVIRIAPEFLSILIGITLAASINLLLAGVLFTGVLLYVALLVNILRPVAAMDSVAHNSWNDGWNEAAAAVHQIETVKQAVGEERETRVVEENLLNKTYDLWSKIERIWSNVSFFQRTIVFATQLTVFILSAKFVAAGTITVGELVALNGYALMFFGPFVALGHSWQIIQNGITSALHAEEVFNEPEEQYVPPDALAFKQGSGHAEFKGVTFSYGLDQPLVLNNVEFAVKSGEVVALVGESGVGKSTTIGLLSGYYFPTEGSVFVDGVDTRRANLVELRRQIAVVPQEIALFNDTIRTNISYGSFDASDEAIVQAAKEAHIDEFINSLPMGYGTLVGERGIKLSVGQKQRVAIARAILRDPRMLILDEPTSALDAKTEEFVSKALERLMKGRTTFIIAHRLSTVRKADRILVFDGGRIVESGTHQELLKKKKGVYRKLYDYQIGLH